MAIKINLNHTNQFYIIILLATDKTIKFLRDHGPILFEPMVGRKSYIGLKLMKTLIIVI